MSHPLVECIPNFSDARRPEVIEQIVNAIKAVPGISVLDRHSDLDHNRTVVTFVGPPQAVEEAAFQSIAAAGKLIDLNVHEGAHPRIGATDVVPFVPIRDINMVECVEMARRLGKRVGSELGIPVYLYEEAATRPDRTNLENIRRGQFEGLKEEVLTNPERKPDFGPAQLGSAGATVIGARQPLVAFNVYLTTDDVSIAQKIAKVVRNSSGGLRFVKGMGVLVDGRAQVSMNLTNYRQTSIARVVEMVRREAQRYGVGVHHSELVGLIPQEALVDAAVWYTQLDQFEPSQILEQKLFEAMRSEASETAGGAETPDFIDQLAAATPTPGGGSAAAHTGAAAAALAAMVARLTVGKKKYAAVEAEMWQIIEQADELRGQLKRGVEEDARSFDGIMEAMRLPKDTEEQQSLRAGALEKATLHASRVPLSAAEKCLAVMGLCLKAAELGNLNAISDAASGLTLSRAALGCAAYNVRINLSSLSDPAPAVELLERLKTVESEAERLHGQLGKILAERAPGILSGTNA